MNIDNRIFHEDADIENNITIELPEVKRGNKTSVSYNGILNNSGAEKVYLHYGYDGWKNAETVPMKKDITGGYNAEIKVVGKEQLNFCFKDNADNWDNNNGLDWKVEINP